MKFLIISNLYEPYARGGAEAVVKTAAEGFVARENEVLVLTAGPRHYGLRPKEEWAGGVRVLRFFPLNIYFVFNDWRFPKILRALARLIDTFNLHSARVVDRIIKKEKPDVVITHNLVGIGLLVPWVIRQSGVRHIHTLHDVQLVHPSGLLIWGKEKQAERFWPRRIYEKITRVLFGSPDVVNAPSQWLLDFYQKHGFFPKSKTAVVPNPVSIPQTLPPLMGGAKGGVSRLLYAGQLEPHKGVSWLLNLDPRSQIPDPRVVLEIAGSGSLEPEVQKAAQENPEKIIFLGKLSRQALFQKFTEVDALMVPSLCYENAPQIISEALSVGLPIIASRIGGIPELVQDGENGFLFTPGSIQEFEQNLDRLKGLC